MGRQATRAGLVLALAALPALGRTQTDQIRRIQTTIVVSHDPALIRLNGNLVSDLFTQKTLRSIRNKALGELAANEALDIIASVDDGPAGQPPGVFVGRLVIQVRETVKKPLGEKLVSECVKALQKSLMDRLSRRQRSALREALAVVEHDIDQLTAKLIRVNERVSELGSKGGVPDRLLDEVAKIRAQQRDVKAELDTEEVGLDLLARQLNTARKEYKQAQDEREVHASELAKMESDARSVMVAVERLPEKNKNDRAHLQAELNKLQVTVSTMKARQDSLQLRIADVAKSVSHTTQLINAATLRTHKLKRLYGTTVDQLRDHEKQLAIAREIDGQASRRRLEVRLLEQKLDVLHKRMQQLRLELATLKPVRVERWK